MRTIKKAIRGVATIALLLAIAVLIVDQRGQYLPESQQDDAFYAVAWVSDGDTIVIERDGKEVTVRLIGIDCPESVHPDATKNTPEGKLASDFTKKLLKGKNVRLEYDIQSKDKYDRDLAYVFLEDGTFVNEKIVAEGYAYVATIVPNVKYAENFRKAFSDAVKNKRGLWADQFSL